MLKLKQGSWKTLSHTDLQSNVLYPSTSPDVKEAKEGD